eukprot:scpid96320/ scgid25918/ UPF0369 protein C6orf57
MSILSSACRRLSQSLLSGSSCGCSRPVVGQWARFASDSAPDKTNEVKQQDEKDLHPDREREPLKQHPGGINPVTGERGGPAGPEPTRYGDWERKGRTFDF